MSRALYRLHFPPTLDEADVVDVLAGLASDLFRRKNPRPTVLLRLCADADRIVHELEVAEAFASTVLGRLRASLTSLRIERVKPSPSGGQPTQVAELRISTIHRPLRTDRAAATPTGILAAVGGLARGERVELVWVLTGARVATPARLIPRAERSSHAPVELLFPRPASWHEESELVRQERLKQAQPLLLGLPRVAVWARSTGRAKSVLHRVITALRSTSAPGVSLLPGGCRSSGCDVPSQTLVSRSSTGRSRSTLSKRLR